MFKKLLFLAAASLTINIATAADGGFSVVPTAWRLESYGANGVVLWFTPSRCGNGQILMPGTATLAEHNRLYATVLSAKATGGKVFINYNDDTGNCIIVSYGIDAA